MRRHREEVIKDLRNSENPLMKEAADYMENLIGNVGWSLKNLFTLEDDYKLLLEESKEMRALFENTKEKAESWHRLFHEMADERNVALDRIKDLEHALEFICKKASSPKIWYAGVARAALDGEVKAPEGKK